MLLKRVLAKREREQGREREKEIEKERERDRIGIKREQAYHMKLYKPVVLHSLSHGCNVFMNGLPSKIK